MPTPVRRQSPVEAGGAGGEPARNWGLVAVSCLCESMPRSGGDGRPLTPMGLAATTLPCWGFPSWDVPCPLVACGRERSTFPAWSVGGEQTHGLVPALWPQQRRQVPILPRLRGGVVGCWRGPAAGRPGAVRTRTVDGAAAGADQRCSAGWLCSGGPASPRACYLPGSAASARTRAGSFGHPTAAFGPHGCSLAPAASPPDVCAAAECGIG